MRWPGRSQDMDLSSDTRRNQDPVTAHFRVSIRVAAV